MAKKIIHDLLDVTLSSIYSCVRKSKDDLSTGMSTHKK